MRHPKDNVRAVQTYTRAAEQGTPLRNTLALSYAHGEGVAQDWGRAVHWYTKAAEQGAADAQCSPSGTGQRLPP